MLDGINNLSIFSFMSGVLYVLSHLVLMQKNKILSSICIYSHFIDEETDLQRTSKKFSHLPIASGEAMTPWCHRFAMLP